MGGVRLRRGGGRGCVRVLFFKTISFVLFFRFVDISRTSDFYTEATFALSLAHRFHGSEA
jgi:hypothetical protein